MTYRIAVDTGGTFTDIALIGERDDTVKVAKVPSTPENPALAVISGIKKILKENNLTPEFVSYLLHGTTVATNALLELKGARTALLTTKGFRDVLEIGRQTRPDLYNFFRRKPVPVVTRDLRFEVEERIFHTGKVMKELDRQSIDQIIKTLKEKQVESAAICFIHSYRNPVHEEMVKNMIAEELPEIFVSCSFEVLPEFREYERMSTVCINAYVMPAIKKYFEYLEDSLQKERIKSPLYIMQSNGGIITSGVAREQSARTVLSGPAGGVIAGLFMAKTTGKKNLITMDMGGTSLDVSLISQSAPSYSTESCIGGYPLKLPMIEIHTIGAGGGSTARLDTGGALKVGPESAGAYPGPACYGKGGIAPTVTDANLVLGRINPGYLLEGEMKLNLDKAREAVYKKLALPLGITLEEAAEGIIKVINANMVRSIRVVSVEKGYDPREFAMVAFGGAGPLHAVELARELAVEEVIIPPNPGINSALGMLAADVRRDYVLTRIMREEDITPGKLEEFYEQMESEALDELEREGFEPGIISFMRSIDLRYPRQAYEINVPLPEQKLRDEDIKKTVKSFHHFHKQYFGYSHVNECTEIVNLRLAAVGKMGTLKIKEYEAEGEDPFKALLNTRQVFFSGKYMDTPVYNRQLLKPGNVIYGPAVIEQLDSTTVIIPGKSGYVDKYHNLIIS
ncbi:MAG: 5-oxoprolinase [Firmicutes bacterium HGW-Firmicutes-13]|nr:MAG: 5-oxoprolinase [Firmicutes bacterium HGW-Firmicutes-13]